MSAELSSILGTSRRCRSSTSTASSRPRAWSMPRTCCAPTRRPRASPRRRARQRSRPRLRVLPRPLAAGVSDVRDLSVAAGLAAVEAGDLSTAELAGAYTSADDELGAFLGGPTSRSPAASRAQPPAPPSPSRTSSASRACPRRRARRSSRATCRPTRATPRSSASSPRATVSARRHGRVRDGLLERELRLRRRPQPLGLRARSRRVLWRLGRSRRRRPRAVRDRDRYRRLDPPARGVLRRRRPEADLRLDLALGHDRLRLLARSVRTVHPRRHRRRASAAGDAGSRPARHDLDRDRGRRRLPSREDLSGLRVGIPRELASEAEGMEDGVREVFERTIALCESLGASVEETSLPNARFGISAYYVIAPAEAPPNLARYDGVRFGERVESHWLGDMYELDPLRRLRRRGEAPHHARHLRALLRLLRRLLRPCAAGPDADRPRLPAGLRRLRPAADADLADRRLRARGAHRRSARDVHVRLLHGADVACRCARDLDSRWACRIAGRAMGSSRSVVQLVGAPFSESKLLDAAHALEGAIGFDPTGAWNGGSDA